ncbi:uncharacterized protein LOC114876308 [Osmia bicornis bicornis]|uniref:uncharacterized protein LOC114876308 n=1 Tax=Osmia bicornis bicornis TaxID=1437191 RepID=UPI001EAF6BF6|nr:uncharacterized protein LOC114876308 [Osmia bicornis bicornis]
MACNDIQKMEVINLATKYQQSYYELLPNWFEYDSTNYEYIRHQVGYALFGHSQIINQGNGTSPQVPTGSNDDTFGGIVYDKKSCKVIDKIYQQIIQYGRKDKNSPIYTGIIYNIIMIHQKPQKEIKETDEKKEIRNMHSLPVFKIQNDKDNVWYIDNEGRIYKNWKDYLTNNTLPKCTMILPKDGIYQCDPNCKVSEYSSTVWIETLDSPACATKRSVLSALDIAANTISLSAGIGLGVATFVTPAGPALITAGLIVNGISGTWNIARSSQKLIDFSKHKQSINPISRNAFPAWLGMSSSVLAIGTSGGAMLLSRAARTAAQGKSISTAVKLAHDSMVVSSLTVHGVGIAYDGYCLIDKYQEEKKIDLADITIFVSHVLFFSNTVINAKLANQMIRTWKGTIFEKFKNILRINRLKEECNKIVRMKNPNVQKKSEGIIYGLRKVISSEEFLNSLSRTSWSPNSYIHYQNDKIVLNNMKLLDPMVFIGHVLTIGSVGLNLIQSGILEDIQGTDEVFMKLKRVLGRLLNRFYPDKVTSEQSLDVNNFDELLTEMKHVTNAKDILIKIFKISTIVISRCNSPDQFFNEMIYFLWSYCKVTLKEHISETGCKIKNNGSWVCNLLHNIVTCMHDYIDTLGDDLFAAFYTYILNRERTQMYNYNE